MGKIVRALSEDGGVLCSAINSTDMVRETARVHEASPVVTAALGRMTTAASIMGGMLKYEGDTLTLRINGGGPCGTLTAVSDYRGNVKCCAGNAAAVVPAKADGRLDVAGVIGNEGTLTVVKDMGLKEPYVGDTMLVTSEIAEDLTYYFASSEQVPSSVGLGVLMERDNTVKCAGGFIIQMMPFATEETIAQIEENLKRVTSVTELLDKGFTPERILEELLGNVGLEITDTMLAKFTCNCSKERVEKAVASIGRKDIREMIDEGKDIEVKCHFCNSAYNYTVEDLKRIIKRSR